MIVSQTNRAGSCDSYKNGQYKRTFNIQLTDRYGRVSNVVSKTLNVKTCEFAFCLIF